LSMRNNQQSKKTIERTDIAYNVYKNDEKINLLPVNELLFTDTDVQQGEMYQYYVTAIYPTGESIPSDSVEVTIPYSDNHFIPVWSGNGMQHMNIFVYSALLDGEALDINDEIAVFDGEYCVGAVKLNTAIQNYVTFVASLDDPSTPEIDGYTQGNPIQFKIWKASLQREYQYPALQTDYVSGSNQFAIGTTSIVNLSAVSFSEQNIALINGWNMISTYIMPEYPQMDSVFNALIENNLLIKIQNESGASMESLPVIGWVNNIGNLVITEGYRIKVSDQATLSITGTSVNLPLNIPLTTGWNIVSYPYTVENNAMDILEQIKTLGYLVKVQSETGASIEALPVIGWVNNIGNFMPGKGYSVKVNQDCELLYADIANVTSVCASKKEILTIQDRNPQHYQKVWTGNGWQHFNLYLQVNDFVQNNLNIGDEIAVFDGDYCVGVSVYQSENSFISIISSMTENNEVINGYTPGHQYRLKIWSHQSQSEMTNLSLDLVQGVSLFESGGTAIVQINSLSNDDPHLIPLITDISTIYPNPFNPRTSIEFSLNKSGNVSLEIYNIKGQKVRTLVNEHRNAGCYQVNWEGEDNKHKKVSSGIYFTRLLTDDKQIIKKMILIK
ncbi:MAG TPA: T9SS type A sorting domain-containing protein, partial [Candidatus Cloacimonadota bacterium]|nr:T9SS type A sorting domain-containing protein [Candidatus Cloacimonadota bacterium]